MAAKMEGVKALNDSGTSSSPRPTHLEHRRPFHTSPMPSEDTTTTTIIVGGGSGGIVSSPVASPLLLPTTVQVGATTALATRNNGKACSPSSPIIPPQNSHHCCSTRSAMFRLAVVASIILFYCVVQDPTAAGIPPTTGTHHSSSTMEAKSPSGHTSPTTTTTTTSSSTSAKSKAASTGSTDAKVTETSSRWIFEAKPSQSIDGRRPVAPTTTTTGTVGELKLRFTAATVKFGEILSSSAICEIAIIFSGHCGVLEGQETAVQCVHRLGWARFQPVLPTRCLHSSTFQEALREYADFLPIGDTTRTTTTTTTATTSTKSGVVGVGVLAPNLVTRSQLLSSRKDLPPREWPRHAYPASGALTCASDSSGVKWVHPIGFAIPGSLVADHVGHKVFDFSPYLPTGAEHIDQEESTQLELTSSDEWLVRALNEMSYFAFTKKQSTSGWDSLTHYAILASGSIPYFPDMDLCASTDLQHLPKKLIREAMTSLAPNVGMLTSGGRRVKNDFFVQRKRGQRSNLEFHRAASLEWSTRYQEQKQQQEGGVTHGTVAYAADGVSLVDTNEAKAAHDLAKQEKYHRMAEQLLNYTRTYLTTASLAAYVLETVAGGPVKKKTTLPKKVLLVGGGHPTQVDFLQLGIAHGLSEIGVPSVITGGPHSLQDWIFKQKATDFSSEALMESAREGGVRRRRNPKVSSGGDEAAAGGGRGGGTAEAVGPRGWLFGSRFDPAMVEVVPTGDGGGGTGSSGQQSTMHSRIEKAEFDLVIYFSTSESPLGGGGASKVDSRPYWSVVAHHIQQRAFVRDGYGEPLEDAVSLSQQHLGVVFQRELGLNSNKMHC